MKSKRILCLVLAALTCFALCACGNKNSGTTKNERGTAYAITIYRARATGMVNGTYDDDVKKALEDKFYEDTGINLVLNMNIYNGDDLTQKVNTGIGNSNVALDAFTSTLNCDASSSLVYKYGSDKYGSVLEVGSLLQEHGQNILKAIRQGDDDHLVERAGYINIDGDMKMQIIPAVYNTKSYAIMLRKDHWQKAYDAGKTALDPEDYDISQNDEYKNLTLEEFDGVMRAVKETVEGLSYPVTGYSWDLCRTIGASFGADNMNWTLDDAGNIYPYQFSDEYGKLLDLCYTWAKDGIWEKDSANLTDDMRLINFLAGKNSAYIVFPEIENMINTAANLKLADANSECMLLAPFKTLNETTGEYEVTGYYEQAAAFQGLAIPYDAKNSDILIKFIDWMYSNPDNYEIAKYGIKGVHWVDGNDYKLDGKTYKTWAYPTDKYNEYMQNTPYSGCWEILRNVNVSNRINDGWTPVQKRWYVYASEKFDGVSNEKTCGIMFPEAPKSINSTTFQQHQTTVTNVYSNAIAARLVGGVMPSENLRTAREAALEGCKEYFDWYKGQYGDYIAWFNANLGGNE